MKCVLLTLACVFVASAVGKAGFKVRFGVNLPFQNNYLISLPQSVSEARKESWTREERPNQVLPSLTLYCHSSYIICVLYDDTAYVAGIQVALPVDEFKGAIWDWETRGYSQWNPSNGKTYWATQQYYVNEEFLAISAERRVASRDKKKLLQVGGSVWVTGIRGELVEITNRPEGLVSKGFFKQGCIPGMGTHYWRLSAESKCDEEFFPWFTLHNNSEDLVGTGLATFGTFEEKKGDWFERPSTTAVKLVVPRGPACLDTIAANPGVVTIHIFYIDNPWRNLCIF